MKPAHSADPLARRNVSDRPRLTRLMRVITVLACCFGPVSTTAGKCSAAAVPPQEPGNAAETPAFADADIEFFENKIRPLLVDHCLQCHGEDDQKRRGGLRLTSRAALLAGGDSGPAIVPGDAAESLLIGSVRYEDFEMPPAGPLDEAQIELLVEWIERGAPDPRQSNEPSTATPEIDMEKGREFWAFQPVAAVQPPVLPEDDWAETPIDRFILQRLQAEQIPPVGDASRESLLRRGWIALIGLPPEPADVDAFLADPRPVEVAFAEVVDRLLDSPHFGERWGRHWLDVARYAESSGGGRSLMFPEAWRFRDYVIAAFNADKPFDQFIREQIAGDLLPFDSHEQKVEQLVATGFLALGPTNYEQQDKQRLRMEVIDEQVDTVGRAFLGLTLGCARCHDHKFDPIPMDDYYALAGIFGSTQSLVDGNVSRYVRQPLASADELRVEKVYREQVAALSQELAAARQRLEELGGEARPAAGTGRNASSGNLPGIVLDDRDAVLSGTWKASTSVPGFVNGRYVHDNDQGKGQKRAVFSPQLEVGGQYEVRLSYTPGANRATNVPVTVHHQDGQSLVRVNQVLPPPEDGRFVSLGIYRFEADNTSSVTIETTGTDGHVIVDAVQFLKSTAESAASGTSGPETSGLEKPEAGSPAGAETRATAETGPDSPVVAEELQQQRQRVRELDQRLRDLKATAPPPFQMAMSVRDVAEPADGHLLIRGSVHHPGPVVKRGFLSVCADQATPVLAAGESGRLQLARWIASPQHPLTARVYVNRIWRHLFGRGLVETTDNFGLMGRRPTHPQLLDYLAGELVREGWSTKQLIRRIMLSHVFRLSSQTQGLAEQKDDTNRLLWRANRRRVDAEVLRDSILFVSGELDLTAGGRTIRQISEYDLGYEFDTVRRSVYVPAFRNSMLDLFEVFDFANPNLVTGHRHTSTLPTQALFLMNSPLLIGQSQKAARRLLEEPDLTPRQRIELAYRRALIRRPQPRELEHARQYLIALGDRPDEPSLQAWSSFCHALFASLDFRYID